MSYARVGADSDVYVYLDGDDGLIHCAGCLLLSSSCGGKYRSIGDALVHLVDHNRVGHKVPESAILLLWRDVGGRWDLGDAKSEGV